MNAPQLVSDAKRKAALKHRIQNELLIWSDRRMLVNHREINILDVPMHAPASIILYRITRSMSMLHATQVTFAGLLQTQGCGVERHSFSFCSLYSLQIMIHGAGALCCLAGDLSLSMASRFDINSLDWICVADICNSVSPSQNSHFGYPQLHSSYPQLSFQISTKTFLLGEMTSFSPFMSMGFLIADIYNSVADIHFVNYRYLQLKCRYL